MTINFGRCQIPPVYPVAPRNVANESKRGRGVSKGMKGERERERGNVFLASNSTGMKNLPSRSLKGKLSRGT